MIQISKREKTLIKILIGIVGFSISYFIIFMPLKNYIEKINNKQNENQKKIKKLNTIYEKFLEAKKYKSDYEKFLKKGKSLSHLIESYSEKANIMDKKTSSRNSPPTTHNKLQKSTSNVKFEGVDIREFMKFLYFMENNDNIIIVNQLKIRKAVRNTYDVTVKFESYTLNQ
jgi:hypothetical protein